MMLIYLANIKNPLDYIVEKQKAQQQWIFSLVCTCKVKC